jgi:ribosomal protein S13
MDKSRSIKKQVRAKRLNIAKKAKTKEQRRVIKLTKSDIKRVANIMQKYWIDDEIESDLARHFSMPNISVAIEHKDEIKAILMITVVSDDIAIIMAVYSKGYRYTKRVYKILADIKDKLSGYKFLYITTKDIAKNHSICSCDGVVKCLI